MGSFDSDVEAPKEETEKEANERKMKEEELKKEEKEKQDALELIHVFVAFIIILGLATGTVFFKLKFFPTHHNQTFDPLPQEVQGS
jgi:cytoskeletal protein RodZ